MADDKKNRYIGYIYLDRHIQEGWLWEEKPFSKGQAWIDLILLANYEDKKMPYKDKIITCKRGTVNLSVLYLANRWGWDRRTVNKFLKQLQDGGSIKYKPSRYRTTILIINYEFYQNKQTTKPQRNVQRNVQQNVQRDVQRDEQQKPTSALGSDENSNNGIYNEMYNEMYNSMHNTMNNSMYNSMNNSMYNSMHNGMYITKKGKERISKDKELKERISKEKEGKENINDSLFREEHGGISREEWESGTRFMGQSY